MKFLADENFPAASLYLLRAEGYDVFAISESSPSLDDEVIMAQAVHEERIILTFDRDYGELIYLQMQAAPMGVVYFRFKPLFPLESAQLLLQLLKSKTSLVGQFTVVTRVRVRQRPLP